MVANVGEVMRVSGGGQLKTAGLMDGHFLESFEKKRYGAQLRLLMVERNLNSCRCRCRVVRLS